MEGSEYELSGCPCLAVVCDPSGVLLRISTARDRDRVRDPHPNLSLRLLRLEPGEPDCPLGRPAVGSLLEVLNFWRKCMAVDWNSVDAVGCQVSLDAKIISVRIVRGRISLIWHTER